MVSLNRVLLIGNLTKDPELRYIPSGTPVANLRLAVNSSFKDQAGQRKEETCFVTVVVWSRQAEICQQYLKKGRSVFIEGRLIYRSWETEGKTRSTMEVRADRVQFLGLPAASRDAAQAGPPSGAPREMPVATGAAPAYPPPTGGAGRQAGLSAPARFASQSEAAGGQAGASAEEPPEGMRSEDAEPEAAAEEGSDADVPF